MLADLLGVCGQKIDVSSECKVGFPQFDTIQFAFLKGNCERLDILLILKCLFGHALVLRNVASIGVVLNTVALNSIRLFLLAFGGLQAVLSASNAGVVDRCRGVIDWLCAAHREIRTS